MTPDSVAEACLGELEPPASASGRLGSPFGAKVMLDLDELRSVMAAKLSYSPSAKIDRPIPCDDRGDELLELSSDPRLKTKSGRAGGKLTLLDSFRTLSLTSG